VDEAVVRADPDAVDVDVRGRDGVDDAAPGGLGRCSPLYLPTLAGTSQVLRVRSGLICVQLSPPFLVFQSVLAAK
jgi:hypothetical protein